MNRRTHLQLWITKFGVDSQFYLLVTPVAFHLHHANLQQQVEQPNFQVIVQSFNQIGVTCNTTSTEMAKLGHLPHVADGAVILTAIDNFTTQVAAVDNCLGEVLCSGRPLCESTNLYWLLHLFIHCWNDLSDQNFVAWMQNATCTSRHDKLSQLLHHESRAVIPEFPATVQDLLDLTGMKIFILYICLLIIFFMWLVHDTKALLTALEQYL